MTEGMNWNEGMNDNELDRWLKGWMIRNEQLDRLMKKWTTGQVNEGVNDWIGEWRGEWMNEWMGACMYACTD